MFILAKLVFKNYIPEKLTKGMWFIQHIKDVIYGRVYEYDRIFEMTILGQLSPEDFDAFIQINGYPVKPVIMSITANPDNYADVLATEEQIGWWDDGPQSDELRDITIADINYILSDEDGIVEIEVRDYTDEDDDHMITPVLYDNKVTVRIPTDYEEDGDDWEELDDMDDLTDYDDPEWPHDHPKDKTDIDPQDYETE